MGKNHKRVRYLTFSIASTIGRRQREKFVQPYQIWLLTKTIDGEIDEGQHSKNIILAESLLPQDCQINSVEHLIETVCDLKENNLFKVTDG